MVWQSYLSIKELLFCILSDTPEKENLTSKLLVRFYVELQGFEPWSRQGSRQAFYVRIYA